jgi:NADPH2:quinone reductase
MKAAYINEPGAPDQIVYGDLPDPTPTGAQAVVKVGAVSVNPIDTYIRGGAKYWDLPKPYIIGCDLAGTIVALGPEAKRFKVGDRVWCSNQGLMGRQGAFAELAAVDEAWLNQTPDNVTDEAAAASALVGITAHLGLIQHAQLQPGETIFVHGGTGGVGSMVVQMAKIIGARVITTGGSDEKCAKAKELGAAITINYKTQNVAEEVKKAAPQGVNVYWETVREPNFDEIVGMLAERGRIVIMAGRDARPAFPVGPFYVKQCSLLGFVMFKASPIEQRHAAEDISRWLSSGKLKPQITKVLPLAQAAEAHRLQEENTLQKAGTIAGKIVLKP